MNLILLKFLSVLKIPFKTKAFRWGGEMWTLFDHRQMLRIRDFESEAFFSLFLMNNNNNNIFSVFHSDQTDQPTDRPFIAFVYLFFVLDLLYYKYMGNFSA